MMKISTMTAQPRIPRLTIDWALGEAGLQIETFREDRQRRASNVHVPIASTWNNPSGLVFATAATTASISLVAGVATRRKSVEGWEEDAPFAVVD